MGFTVENAEAALFHAINDWAKNADNKKVVLNAALAYADAKYPVAGEAAEDAWMRGWGTAHHAVMAIVAREGAHVTLARRLRELTPAPYAAPPPEAYIRTVGVFVNDVLVSSQVWVGRQLVAANLSVAAANRIYEVLTDLNARNVTLTDATIREIVLRVVTEPL